MAATKPSSKRVIAMISTWLHRLLRKAPPDHKEPLTAPAWPWADELAWLYEPTETPCGELAPYFLTQLNTLWPDLDDARGINMNSRRGYANAVAYWESPLRQHCPDIVWPRSEFPPVLFEPDAQTDQDGPLPFSLGLVAILNVRPDMGDFECHSRLGRIRMLHWRLTLGSKEYRHLAFTPEELAQLQRPCQQHAGRLAHLSKLAELLPALYTHLPDRLQPLLEGDRLAFDACWKESGDGLLAALHSAPRIGQSLEYTPPPDIGTAEANGINVVGFATGQFGVGEDARMATRVLIQAGLKPCVYEPPIPLAVAHRQSGWIDQHMQPEPAYRFNLITLPAVDTLRLHFLQQSGVLHGRYNICGWQWELPKWPTHWKGMMAMPDEIWAQSRFLQEMFSQATDKPVTYIPSAVEIPSFTPKHRQDFRLPTEAFAFLSVFDCNAWYQRKNPLAAVRAFQKAFPKTERGVQLIVKMMNSRPEVPEHQELIRLAGLDDRIVIIDTFLSRDDMLALLNCADVFVSLHRSEGFGRVVAECMLMGKPVISTNYSGSVDFAHEGTAYVVDGPMISLKKGDYADHEGQSWMDPDIDLAADAMKRCMDDPEGTAAMALLGQAYIREHHSIEAVARLYAERLRAIGVM